MWSARSRVGRPCSTPAPLVDRIRRNVDPYSQAKRPLEVTEVSIADDGRLLIRPAEFDRTFEMIWRAAAEVRWEETLRCFVCPKPREWSYRDWYMHAGAALNDELG